MQRSPARLVRGALGRVAAQRDDRAVDEQCAARADPQVHVVRRSAIGCDTDMELAPDWRRADVDAARRTRHDELGEPTVGRQGTEAVRRRRAQRIGPHIEDELARGAGRELETERAVRARAAVSGAAANGVQAARCTPTSPTWSLSTTRPVTMPRGSTSITRSRAGRARYSDSSL